MVYKILALCEIWVTSYLYQADQRGLEAGVDAGVGLVKDLREVEHHGHVAVELPGRVRVAML